MSELDKQSGSELVRWDRANGPNFRFGVDPMYDEKLLELVERIGVEVEAVQGLCKRVRVNHLVAKICDGGAGFSANGKDIEIKMPSSWIVENDPDYYLDEIRNRLDRFFVRQLAGAVVLDLITFAAALIPFAALESNMTSKLMLAISIIIIMFPIAKALNGSYIGDSVMFYSYRMRVGNVIEELEE